MRVQTNGKSRRTASEWREILDRFHQSGMSVRAFCSRESLGMASFQRWQKKLNGSSGGSSDGRPEGRGQEFVEVNSSDGLPGFWSVEVELPDGRVLRMRG